MMWLKTDAEGKPTVEGMTKPYCYHIDQFSELQPLIHKVLEYAGKMGLDMIQGDHEDAPGTARAELPVRQGRAHGRPADHLPPDLSSGGPRARRLPLLHAEAVHGGVRQRLPPQLLALAGRGEHVHARTPTTRGFQESWASAPSPACSSTSPRSVAIIVSDGELLPPLRRRRLLGARLRRLGLPEPHDGAADQRARAGSSTGRSTPPSTPTCRWRPCS